AVLDIFAHEYMHAVTEHTCDLVYQGESGALNESFSDIFGVCIEFANQPDGRADYPGATPGHADWLMGEDSWLEATALRDLRDPSNPDTVGAGNELPKLYQGTYWYTGFGDNGGVHYNCGVQNHFFYLLCEGGSGTNDTSAFGYDINGIGVQAGEQIAYRALSEYCTPETTYAGIKVAWVSAARDLDPRWVRSTRAAWNAVLGLAPPPPMAVASPPVLPDGRVGSWYSYLLTAKDGIGPYVWALLPDAPKPDWLELAADGTVSGLPPPEAVGTNAFTVTVVDAAGDVATNSFTFLIREPFGIPYAESFENSGQSPDSWTQSAVLKQQPWGFANGSPYGHPNSAYDGAYCARLAVLETALTNSVTRLETPMIDFGDAARAGRLTFRHFMANWEGGQDQLRVYYKTGYYEPWQLLASFTAATESWTLRSVELPDPNRSYYLAFEGTANYGYGVHLDAVRIFDPTVPLGFATPEQLPDAYTERPYTVALTVTNGMGPFAFEVVGGALPTGMVLSADGVISGTVDAVQSALFTVRVTDSVEPLATAEQTFRLNVELPVAALFSEDFEHGGNLPAGWTQEYVERAVNWACQKGGGNIIQYNQPPDAHSGGYNATLFQATWDVYALNNNHITRLVTPPINLGEAPGSIRLVFWHCMIAFEDGQDELRVYYKNSAAGAWTLLAEYTGNVPVWTQRTLPLPNPTATYYLAFEGNARFGHGVCIDDVLIHDGASAPVITTAAWLPEALAGLPYAQTLAASGGVEPYTWSVVSNALPAGLAFGTNGVISGTPGSAGTAVFRVAVTGGDGYASTNLFALRVNALPAGNFTETFDAGTGLPEGWTQQILKGTFGWTFRKGSPENQPAAAYSPQTNACFYANGASYGNAVARLITPLLNLGTGTTNATLSFWEYRASDGSYRDWLKVYYRNTPDGEWVWLTNFTGTASSWTQRTVALPATSPTYALAFEGFSNGGYGIGLDDVEISGDFAGYGSWQSTHFTPEELNDPAVSGDEADPDGDGVSNGLEYAMGLDPWSPDTEGLLWGGVTAQYLTLTFRMGKQALAAGTLYTVEACTNLLDQAWTVEQVTEYRRDDSNEWWQAFFRHDVPVTNAPQRFLRLRVTLP
ncbi:MAG: M4 family metallopeptidase, partial [Kiritimatiellia bacterium]|nr:M4 family metallopeptidase [Kiritimatiellia bacterium]